ncbi:hypothetical protein GCM10022416_61770 [Actinomadura keratinilytica]|uniref:Uncharacterized protein n=1 Tax=Actinomadura keratinilytica TaxID=547461 RepID=A0ABP6UKZ1_9ACTN
MAAGVGDVVCSPHHHQEWAQRAVFNPHVLNVVCSLLGPRVAVAEPTLLLVKRPGRFAVPPHQDGLNGGVEVAEGDHRSAADQPERLGFGQPDGGIGGGQVHVHDVQLLTLRRAAPSGAGRATTAEPCRDVPARPTDRDAPG